MLHHGKAKVLLLLELHKGYFIKAGIHVPCLYYLNTVPSSSLNILLGVWGRRDAFLARPKQRSTTPLCNTHTPRDLHLNCTPLPFIFYVSLSLTQLCEGMVGIPFDSANSIWWKNKYTRGVGGKKRVGVGIWTRWRVAWSSGGGGGTDVGGGQTEERRGERKRRQGVEMSWNIQFQVEVVNLSVLWSRWPPCSLHWRMWDISSSSPPCNATLIVKISNFLFYGSFRVT